MKKFIRSLIKLVFVISIIESCIVQKKISYGYPPDFDFIEMSDSFEMKIIAYMPSFPCGGYASASNCIGQLVGGDTIRVLTLCNTDTTFKSEQIVKVIPRKKPTFGVGVGFFIFYDSLGNKIKVNPKVIYGNLIKNN